MVGIYGLGGVGKTTLAKEVAVQLKNLFVDIVFITVSQTVDVEKIQNKVEVAAKRIMNGEKVLIILDDMWEKIDLPEVGIPCGKDHKKKCKVLLTSRSIDVCERMNADRNISVDTLTNEEAWVLFKRMVGERLANDDDSTLEKIAREVTKECGGLPLIIQAVANALKNKPIGIWEAALDRLQNHAPLEIGQEIRKAFTHLKLSYDLLESKEAQSCFLLCSMFREDGDIDLLRLADYGVGLGIFDNLDSIIDAEKRMRIAADTLTSSGLLLSQEDSIVKMHDVVRDVALLITSSSSDQGKEKYLVKAGKHLTQWQPRNRNSDLTKISLMDNEIGKLIPADDDQLHFPHLDTFLIQDNHLSIIPDEFFRGMKDVKVLDMSGNWIRSLPQSLKLLTKLITLDLSFNTSLSEISILGELKDLEILKVRGTGIEVIPKEIGQLTNLRLLDADECRNLSHVTRGVISKLTWLEELYIGIFDHSHAVSPFDLVEISNLKSLRAVYLYTHKDDCHLFPNAAYLETLPEFFFRVDNQIFGSWDDFFPQYHRSRSNLKRQLHISECNLPFTMPIKKLFRVSDGIQLESIQNFGNIIPDLFGESTTGEFKSIQLDRCDNVSCLVKTTDEDAMQTFVTSSYDLIGQRKTTKEKFLSQVEDIILRNLRYLKLLFDCPFQYISLRNLQDIEVSSCSSLLTLFPLSVAQGLSNLRKINIYNCESLMVVISAGDEQTNGCDIEPTEDSETEVGILDDANIVFPSLTNIYLSSLPKLKNFYSRNSTVKYPSLEAIRVLNCPTMKRWGHGVHDMPNLEYYNEETLNLFR